MVEAFIQRIKDVNGILNSVVDERFGEAKQIDQLLKTLSWEKKKQPFQQQPFLGVPFTINCFAVTGLYWTAGLLARKDVKATYDAPVVAAMRRASAIPMAVKNMYKWSQAIEFMGEQVTITIQEGQSAVLRAGEGCVIPFAGSPWGIGSDVGGSMKSLVTSLPQELVIMVANSPLPMETITSF
jgi:fatty acid amide hydrolase 2